MEENPARELAGLSLAEPSRLAGRVISNVCVNAAIPRPCAHIDEIWWNLVHTIHQLCVSEYTKGTWVRGVACEAEHSIKSVGFDPDSPATMETLAAGLWALSVIVSEWHRVHALTGGRALPEEVREEAGRTGAPFHAYAVYSAYYGYEPLSYLVRHPWGDYYVMVLECMRHKGMSTGSVEPPSVAEYLRRFHRPLYRLARLAIYARDCLFMGYDLCAPDDLIRIELGDGGEEKREPWM